MEISSFDDLLLAARAQTEPQRLLFVFTGVELPTDCTPQQRAQFEAGQGGALVPLMCVDKTPQELDSFDTLKSEASQFGPPWVLVFVAALSGAQQRAPTSQDAEKPLEHMVESIKRGDLGAFIPFDPDGHPVQMG